MAKGGPAGSMDMATKRVITSGIQAPKLSFCGSLIDSPCICFNWGYIHTEPGVSMIIVCIPCFYSNPQTFKPGLNKQAGYKSVYPRSILLTCQGRGGVGDARTNPS